MSKFKVPGISLSLVICLIAEAIFLLIWTRASLASTFVGNGGNIGDFELEIALGKINKVFESVDEAPESDNSDLCVCTETLHGNEFCTLLQRLNSQQAAYCSKVLRDHSEVLGNFSQLNAKQVEFLWEEEPLQAQYRDGSRHPSHAVAQNNERRRVVLESHSFLNASSAHRVALLTHELFHFVAIDGKTLTDEDAFGPFSEGKTLLDALGAAVAILAEDRKIARNFQGLERVSRAQRRFAVGLDLNLIDRGREASDKLLVDKSMSVIDAFGELRFQDVSLKAGHESLDSHLKWHSLMDVQESMSLTHFGVGYFWRPIKRPLSRWQETEISLRLQAIAGRAQYEISDGWVKIQDHAPVKGAGIEVQIHLPVVRGFWVLAGCQWRYLSYEYGQLGLKIGDRQAVTSLGGAYAF